MTRTLWGVGACLLALGCKKSEPTAPSVGSNAPSKPAAPAAPAWTAKSQPIELACGDKPLPLPPPQPAAKPSGERPLKHGDAVTQCHDQASVDAACACLVSSIATWGASFQLAAPATCKATPAAPADAQLVEIQDGPDPDVKRGGSALVLLAKRGQTWSAVAVVDAQGDIDLAQTPKLGESLSVVAFEPHPTAAGPLYWIQTRSETHESDMGDQDLEGGVLGTLCTPAFCYAPLKLGTWTYSFTPAKETCEISKLTTLSASFDASAITLQLEHGGDADGAAGRYRL
jgi:hypothetical protein